MSLMPPERLTADGRILLIIVDRILW